MTEIRIKGRVKSFPDKPYKFELDEKDNIILPTEQAELQHALSTLWDRIMEGNETDLISIYNTGAEAYNKKAGNPVMIIIHNLNQIKMATAKKAASKKAAGKKAAPKKAAVKKGAVKKTSTPANGEKKKSQKEIIIELAAKGETIDEIVEISGIQKPNVAHYFSKLKLHPKHAKK